MKYLFLVCALGGNFGARATTFTPDKIIDVSHLLPEMAHYRGQTIRLSGVIARLAEGDFIFASEGDFAERRFKNSVRLEWPSNKNNQHRGQHFFGAVDGKLMTVESSGPVLLEIKEVTTFSNPK